MCINIKKHGALSNMNIHEYIIIQNRVVSDTYFLYRNLEIYS